MRLCCCILSFEVSGMKTIGNILWFIFGGFLSGLSWWLSGLIWCITVIGIPYGRQCFKFASLSFSPFKKDIVYGGDFPVVWTNRNYRMIYINMGHGDEQFSDAAEQLLFINALQWIVSNDPNGNPLDK